MGMAVEIEISEEVEENADLYIYIGIMNWLDLIF